MYNKDGELKDRRELLKVKAKSLAEESRIIRKEERRTTGILRDILARHRREDVRNAARETYMAYGLIKGKEVDQIERPGSKRASKYWKEVQRMIQTYGPLDTSLSKTIQARCMD